MPLAPAFDLRRAGRYQLQPTITLGDVQALARVPRLAVTLVAADKTFTIAGKEFRPAFAVTAGGTPAAPVPKLTMEMKLTA